MKQKKTSSSWIKIILWLMAIGVIGAAITTGFAWMKWNEWVVRGNLPDVNLVGSEKPNITSRVLDRNDKEIGQIYVERRTVLPLNQFPVVLVKAILAAEDKDFQSHPALNFSAIAKAAIGNKLHPNRRARGASTITQQVIKTYWSQIVKDPRAKERTLKRKVQEAYLSVQLEKRWSKDQIFEFYVNQIYLGRQRYGFEEASQYYFGKSVKEVDLNEATLLASLPKEPEVYYREKNWPKWKVRQEYVLDQMLKSGWVSKEDADKAAKASIVLANHEDTGLAVEYMDVAERDLKAKYGDQLGHLGLTVKTTCDLELQKKAREELEKGLDSIDKKNGATPRPQGAVIMMDLHTREVVAMVGGYGQKRGDYNRALEAKRQPGSTFKSIVWAAALEREWKDDNRHLAPSTTFIDEEKTYEIPGSKPWTPKNHTPSTGEEVTMRDALARSLNTISAQITNEIGPDAVVAMANRLGIKSELKRPLGRKGALIAPLSIALGTSEVTPLEMMNAYAVFADQGRSSDPTFLLREKNDAPKLTQAVSPALAYLMTSLLSDVIQNGTAVRAKGQLKRPAAGKTGTTQSATDAWFVGYTADYVTAVWVGNDNNKPLGSYWEGSHAALPIWIEVMKAAHQGKAANHFTRPASGIVEEDYELYLEGKVPPPEEAKPVDEEGTETAKPEEVPQGTPSPATPVAPSPELAAIPIAANTVP